MNKPNDNQPDPGRSQPDGSVRKENFWSRRKAPVIFFGLFVAFCAISYVAYPRPANESAPGYSTVDVVSQAPIGIIDFSARPLSQGTVKVTVTLTLSKLAEAPAGARSATVYFYPPNAIPFKQCPHETPCSQLLTQKEAVSFTSQTASTATAIFYSNAEGIMPAANGLTASAALPQTFYNCPAYDPQCAPTLETQYNLQSSASYDWSSLPYQNVTSGTITWDEQLAGGEAPGRVAVGTSSTGQTRDNYRSFAAGAFIGVAGGALIASLQEILHPDKQAVDRGRQ